MLNKKLDCLLGNFKDQIVHVKEMNENEIYVLSNKMVDEWVKYQLEPDSEEKEDKMTDIVSAITLISSEQGMSKELIDITFSIFLYDELKAKLGTNYRKQKNVLIKILKQKHLTETQHFVLFDYLFTNGIIFDNVLLCERNKELVKKILPNRLSKLRKYITSKDSGNLFEITNQLINFYSAMNSIELLKNEFPFLLEKVSISKLLSSIKENKPIKPKFLDVFLELEQLILKRIEGISKKEMDDLRNNPYNTVI